MSRLLLADMVEVKRLVPSKLAELYYKEVVNIQMIRETIKSYESISQCRLWEDLAKSSDFNISDNLFQENKTLNASHLKQLQTNWENHFSIQTAVFTNDLNLSDFNELHRKKYEYMAKVHIF